ncbi:hypothetical protein ACVXHA_26015 [Escherichia coli]
MDYAVMEHGQACCCGADGCGLERCWFLVFIMGDQRHTAEGNVCHGDVINHKTENSYVYAESGLVTTVGVKDLELVQTKDAVLIADRNAVQDVKKWSSKSKPMVAMSIGCIAKCIVRGANMIDAGDRYQVKRITVKPGEGLSVQMHHHRAEHWVVVAERQSHHRR